MSEILTYSSISNASRAMKLMVLALGGDASPFVASSVILHKQKPFVRPQQSIDT
jgi:hypothetical protein